MQQFSGISHCLIHSILSGRPVILAGPDHLKSLVVMYTMALGKILPYPKILCQNCKENSCLISQNCESKKPVLSWHTGTITEHHIINYKVIGMCIPERLHVQDLMSNETLNQVR